MAALPRSPHRPALSGDRNQCPTCLELFNSGTSFDVHRTGAYGRTDVSGKYIPPTRRCLSSEEMRARGMSRNARGFWITRIREMDAEGSGGTADTTPTTNAADLPLRTAGKGIFEPEVSK